MLAATYRPPRAVLMQRDARAGLAIEDRDLIAEANNSDGCLTAAAEVLCRLYPPLILGGATFPVVQN